MTAVQRKRLKRYVAYLRNLKPTHFDMTAWCMDRNTKKEKTTEELVCALKEGCGTTACAVGHLPLFNPRVFQFVMENRDSDFKRIEYDVKNIQTGRTNTEGFVDYFGVSEYEVDSVFNPFASSWWHDKAKNALYITPKMVAREIERRWL